MQEERALGKGLLVLRLPDLCPGCSEKDHIHRVLAQVVIRRLGPAERDSGGTVLDFKNVTHQGKQTPKGKMHDYRQQLQCWAHPHLSKSSLNNVSFNT